MIKRWVVPYARYATRELRSSLRRSWTGVRPPRVKVIGLQRTGTNYLEQLIETNTDAEVLLGSKPTSMRPIWKHAPPSQEAAARLSASGAIAVLVARDPWSWLLSLHAPGAPSWRRHMARQQPELFRGGALDAAAALEHYVRFYRGWTQAGLPFVRLEDLPAALPALATRLGLALRGRRVIEPLHVPQSPRRRRDPASLREALAAVAIAGWDDALMGGLGYSRPAPACPARSSEQPVAATDASEAA